MSEQEKIDTIKTLCENLGRGSFRWLIYDVLGLSIESGAYAQLWPTLGELNNSIDELAMGLSKEEIQYIKMAITNDLETLENGDWPEPEDAGQRILAKNLLEKLDEA